MSTAATGTQNARIGGSAASAASAAEAQSAVLLLLARIEADARGCEREAELKHLVANDVRALVRARQAFVLQRRGGRGRFEVDTVSGLSTFDRGTPVLRRIERVLERLDAAGSADALHEVGPALPADGDEGDTSAAYPFAHLLWAPLWTRDGRPDAGVLLARETPWTPSDLRIAGRLAGSCGHALALLRSPRPAVPVRLSRKVAGLAATVATVAIGLIPVPLTVLAPVEVVPRDPQVVSMPVDGIVQSVAVLPDDKVAAGQILVQLVDTVARNRLEVATREVAVAEARVERAYSLAFSDARGRHELGIARAELALRIAERNYARDLAAQTTIRAAVDGIAVYSDRKDLEGKPLSTGDRLMEIARPGSTELRIDLPVADSIVLEPGARVRAFLDSDPLLPLEARIAHIDYQARLSDAGVAAHRVVAHGSGEIAPRLGTRGTAQLFGPQSTLAVFLLRRPLGALRQWAGL